MNKDQSQMLAGVSGFLSGVDEVETGRRWTGLDRTRQIKSSRRDCRWVQIVFGPTETEKIWPSVA